jgi:hypothetical protein
VQALADKCGRLLRSSRAAAFHGSYHQAAGPASELALQIVGADHSLRPVFMCANELGLQRHAFFERDLDDPLGGIRSGACDIGFPLQAYTPRMVQDFDAVRFRNWRLNAARQQEAGNDNGEGKGAGFHVDCHYARTACEVEGLGPEAHQKRMTALHSVHTAIRQRSGAPAPLPRAEDRGIRSVLDCR